MTPRPARMIDIHTHVLPGLDDGAPDLAASLAIVSEAAGEGVHMLVATPHIREDHDVQPSELVARTAALQDELDRRDVCVRIVPGGEVAITKLRDLDDDELAMVSLGGNTRFVLVETPYGPVPPAFEEALFGLELRGYTPVVAHPERNPSFQAAPERIAELVHRGALMQLTSSSLVGAEGRGAGSFARELVERELVHALASDVHRPGRANLSLGAARAAVRERHGEQLAKWLTEDVPGALVAGSTPPPRPGRSGRGRFGRRRRGAGER